LYGCSAAGIPGIQGVPDALPTLSTSTGGGAGNTPADLNVRFQWSTTGRCSNVFGYSVEDAVTLQAWTESLATATSLPINPLGMQLLFIGGLRGGVLVEKAHLGIRVPLTRREVWEAITVRSLYGDLGSLSPRATRENTRRRELVTAVRAVRVES
jgi:hypothetical protein